MKGYNSNRMSSGAGRRSQRKQQTNGRLKEGRDQIKTDNTRKESSDTPAWKQSRTKEYYSDMKRQNDSLRKLPKTDKHHLPTFDASTKKGLKDMKSFYQLPPKNQNFKNIIKLGDKIRKKHGLKPHLQTRLGNTK